MEGEIRNVIGLVITDVWINKGNNLIRTIKLSYVTLQP